MHVGLFRWKATTNHEDAAAADARKLAMKMYNIDARKSLLKLQDLYQETYEGAEASSAVFLVTPVDSWI